LPRQRAARAFCSQDSNFTRETGPPDADSSSGGRAAALPPLGMPQPAPFRRRPVALAWVGAGAGRLVGAPVPCPRRVPRKVPCGCRIGGLLDMVYTAAAMIARVHDGSETPARSRAANRGAAIGRAW